MTKYRIVKRNTNGNGDIDMFGKYWYYAQCNIFGVWVDLRHNPFAETYDSYDSDLIFVERWLNNYINGKGQKTEEVVKEYE
jgi:hypothetical protein